MTALDCVHLDLPLRLPCLKDAEELCMQCGFCCNGVIFADIRLQRGDEMAEIARLRSQHGYPKTGRREAAKLHQPCMFFDGVRCGIYERRSRYCREFDCLLLGKVKARRLHKETALGIIRKARVQAERVKDLLRTLGDTNESMALGLRFKRAARRMERIGLDPHTADTYGQLTVAMHALNRLLSESFYPG